VNPAQWSWGEQLVNAQPKALGNSFKRMQTRVLLNPKLVKLIQLIPNAAGFSGFFLCPSASQPKFPQSGLEYD
jgi:hypothetical protein